MSTNKTEHLQLHQWEKDDAFLREEFNENFAAIDGQFQATGAAIAQKPNVVVGKYTGNGGTVTINLGFRPKVVVVDKMDSFSASCELGLDGINLRDVVVTDTGFRVDASNRDVNVSGKPYRYYAFG